MTTPNWRDMAGQPQPDPGPQGPGHPVTWRDLAPLQPQPPSAPPSAVPSAVPVPQQAPQQAPVAGLGPWDQAAAQAPQQAPQQPDWNAFQAAQTQGTAQRPQTYTYPWPQQPPQQPQQHTAAPPPSGGVVGDGGWQSPAAAAVAPNTPQHTAPSAVPPDPAEANAALGMHIAGQGAAATDVDPNQLLAQIKSLEARLNTMQAAQSAPGAPEVVRYATALADHLQARADANPAINTDPDHTYYPALQRAAQLVNASHQVVSQGGHGKDHLVAMARDLGTWVEEHAARFPALDYAYIGQLAREVAGAAVKLGL